MQPGFEILNRITYLTGSAELVARIQSVPAMKPFEGRIVEFLNAVSRVLMRDPRSKAYSDVVTFGFWVRKSSTVRLGERFGDGEGVRLGRGVAFHIAPSNVPVNFAYSLVSGLLCGNANIVRVPSKDFPQVGIIIDALNKALDDHSDMRPYVTCVRYERNREINDALSALADVRIIWGGDQTIAELRKSPLPPRSGEITFADRYSLAVIDSNTYLEIDDKRRVAEDFYNDTFFSDQNACTSPRIIVWTGNRIDEAKAVFWQSEWALVCKKYTFQPIQAVNKLTSSCLIAANHSVRIEPRPDNRIVRVAITELTDDIMDYIDNSGFFLEYDCDDIMELVPICNNKRCQTIGYIGDGQMLYPLIQAGCKGIDRIVPIGKTMDFDLIWDGYDLPGHLTRTIVMG